MDIIAKTLLLVIYFKSKIYFKQKLLWCIKKDTLLFFNIMKKSNELGMMVSHPFSNTQRLKCFPDGSEVKNLPVSAGRCEFNSWVREIPWRRKWQPTPAFLLANLMDRGSWQLQSMGLQRVKHNLATRRQQWQQKIEVI